MESSFALVSSQNLVNPLSSTITKSDNVSTHKYSFDDAEKVPHRYVKCDLKIEQTRIAITFVYSKFFTR